MNYKIINKDRNTGKIYQEINVEHDDILDGKWKYDTDTHITINSDLTKEEFFDNVKPPQHIIDKIERERKENYKDVLTSLGLYIIDFKEDEIK